MGFNDGQAFEILPVKPVDQRARDYVDPLIAETSYAKVELWNYKRNRAKLLIVVNSAWAILVTLLVAFMWG